MDSTTLLGLIAAACTTIAFVPQVYKTLKTRDTRSISLPMYAMFTFGIFLWLIYGLLNHDLPIILANSITCVLAALVLIFKLKYK